MANTAAQPRPSRPSARTCGRRYESHGRRHARRVTASQRAPVGGNAPLYIYIYTCIYLCVCVYIFTYIHIHTCIYMHVYICIYSLTFCCEHFRPSIQSKILRILLQRFFDMFTPFVGEPFSHTEIGWLGSHSFLKTGPAGCLIIYVSLCCA